MKLKNIGCLDSAKAPPEISAPTPAEKQALESRQIAWQHLTEDLLRYLELLGNMIYGSPEIKQAAIEVSFPKVMRFDWTAFVSFWKALAWFGVYKLPG